MSEFYSFSPIDNKGQPFPFKQLEGKPVLIVNTASKCGFTKQYSGLEELYKKYEEQGFVIIGFPCNQFGGQEPENDDGIASFCQLNFGVTFPLMKKSDVNGANANEVFQWLKNEKSGLLGFKGIKWNFEKFLVDKEGKVYQRYSSLTSPSSIEDDLKKLL
ncbi:peroxiredoxin [Martiniozyma asiatica (nom. inval.)]|nr:peroxiredoxin [Martiniozyma asiatica]